MQTAPLPEESIAIIPKRKINSLIKSPEKSAEAVNLVYINDTEEGIIRKRSSDTFEYYFKGKKVTDDEVLLRIKRLVIPPAWEDVWICSQRKRPSTGHRNRCEGQETIQVSPVMEHTTEPYQILQAAFIWRKYSLQ